MLFPAAAVLLVHLDHYINFKKPGCASVLYSSVLDCSSVSGYDTCINVHIDILVTPTDTPVSTQHSP
jgi:hypothetical protein